MNRLLFAPLCVALMATSAFAVEELQVPNDTLEDAQSINLVAEGADEAVRE